MVLIRKMRFHKTNGIPIGFVNIGLENAAVVATLVTDSPSRPKKKGVQNVDVNNTCAKLIMLRHRRAAMNIFYHHLKCARTR